MLPIRTRRKQMETRPSVPVSTSDSHRVFALDALRAGAALLVCAQHLRNATLVDFAQIGAPHLWHRGLYFITHLGHEAVMIFFVLSGYLVGGSVVRSGVRFQFGEYVRARFARLWCVLIPCLALTWVCDHWVLATAPQILNGALAEQWHSLPTEWAYDGSWSALLGNVFFLQTVAVPIYGSNGPLWSLSNEAWYYALFPLVYFTLGRGSLRRRAVCAVLASLLFLAIPTPMLLLFGVWLIGVCLEPLSKADRTSSRAQMVVAGLAFAVCLTLPRLDIFSEDFTAVPDYLIGLSCAWFCLCLLRLRGNGAPTRVPKWLGRATSHLADMSFSLYLSHFPLMLVIAAAFYHGDRLQPTWFGMAAWSASFALLLFAAHGMWWAFERHTPALRGWMRSAARLGYGLH
jgi:peptidoglycan/LPS O-acetylase OafA/YrhL